MKNLLPPNAPHRRSLPTLTRIKYQGFWYTALEHIAGAGYLVAKEGAWPMPIVLLPLDCEVEGKLVGQDL